MKVIPSRIVTVVKVWSIFMVHVNIVVLMNIVITHKRSIELNKI